MFTRRQFMLASAAAGAVVPSALAQSVPTKPKYLVVVLAEGGWDVTVMFDSKLHSSAIDGPEQDIDPSIPNDTEDVQTFGGLTVNVNPFKRPLSSAFFDRWNSQICLVNGVWMGSIAHDPCRFRILTGTMDNTRADIATIVGYELGADLPLGSVDLSGWSMNGALAASAGRIGANSQIKPLIDPNTNFQAADELPFPYPYFASSEQDHSAIAEYLASRNSQLRDARGGDGLVNDHRLDDFDISIMRAQRVRNEATSILSELTLGSSASLKTQSTIAVGLIKNGLCKAVTLDSRQEWDTHDHNSAQHAHFEGLFDGLDTLLSTLESEGIIQDTLVCVLSEMTRTPKLNAAQGKDHWGHTSALLMGGGVRGSSQIGGTTDDTLESIGVDYATGVVDPSAPYNKYENLNAGILDLMGVDPEPWLPGVAPFKGFQS